MEDTQLENDEKSLGTPNTRSKIAQLRCSKEQNSNTKVLKAR